MFGLFEPSFGTILSTFGDGLSSASIFPSFSFFSSLMLFSLLENLTVLPQPSVFGKSIVEPAETVNEPVLIIASAKGNSTTTKNFFEASLTSGIYNYNIIYKKINI